MPDSNLHFWFSSKIQIVLGNKLSILSCTLLFYDKFQIIPYIILCENLD